MQQLILQIPWNIQEKGTKSLEDLTQNKISKCKDLKRRWYSLIINFVFAKPFKPVTRKLKNLPKCIYLFTLIINGLILSI